MTSPLAFRLHLSPCNAAFIIDTAHGNEILGAISLDAYREMINTATTHQVKLQGMTDAEVSDFVRKLFDSPVVAGVVPSAGIYFLKISPSAMTSIEQGRHEATASGRSFQACLKGSGHLIKLSVVPCRDLAQAADFQLRFDSEWTLN